MSNCNDTSCCDAKAEKCRRECDCTNMPTMNNEQYLSCVPENKCCPLVKDELCGQFCDCNKLGEMILFLYQKCTTTLFGINCCKTNASEDCRIRCNSTTISNMTIQKYFYCVLQKKCLPLVPEELCEKFCDCSILDIMDPDFYRECTEGIRGIICCEKTTSTTETTATSIISEVSNSSKDNNECKKSLLIKDHLFFSFFLSFFEPIKI